MRRLAALSFAALLVLPAALASAQEPIDPYAAGPADPYPYDSPYGSYSPDDDASSADQAALEEGQYDAAGAPAYDTGDDGTYDEDGDGADPYATGEVSLEGFQTALAPYGTWTEEGSDGYVWVPSPSIVGASFVPYTCGQWVLTEYGWTWSSCYAWGWAPFHYGRWVDTEDDGWAWVPGTTWGPAWVDWRVGGGYIGWAPMLPDEDYDGGGDDGYGYGYGYGVYAPGAPDGCYGRPASGWSFVPERHFFNSGPEYLPPKRVVQVLPQTRPVFHAVQAGGAVYNLGPKPDYVAYVTRRPIDRAPLSAVASVSPPRSLVQRGVVTPAAPRPWMGAAGPAVVPGMGRVMVGASSGRPLPPYMAPIERGGGRPDFSVYVGGRRIGPGPVFRPAPRPYVRGPGYGYARSYRPGPTFGPTFRPGPAYRPSFRPSPHYGPTFRPGPVYRPSFGPAPRPSFHGSFGAPHAFVGGGFRGGGGRRR